MSRNWLRRDPLGHGVGAMEPGSPGRDYGKPNLTHKEYEVSDDTLIRFFDFQCVLYSRSEEEIARYRSGGVSDAEFKQWEAEYKEKA